MPRVLHVCESCGGHNIQTLAWVDNNTLEFKDDHIRTIENNWCSDCNQYTTVKVVKTYNSLLYNE